MTTTTSCCSYDGLDCIDDYGASCGAGYENIAGNCGFRSCDSIAGVCCGPAGQCELVDSNGNCPAQTGPFAWSYQGLGTSCYTSPGICDVFRGVCCGPEGQCTETDENGACLAGFERFPATPGTTISGATCTDGTNPCGDGACIFGFNLCADDKTYEECVELGANANWGSGFPQVFLYNELCPIAGSCCDDSFACSVEFDLYCTGSQSGCNSNTFVDGQQCPTSGFCTPTATPTEAPTENPTTTPTKAPTENPTASPTKSPTDAPTKSPTENPTATPTKSPTDSPTATPTKAPTDAPTKSPTDAPTTTPTKAPTDVPTTTPTKAPTDAPTKSPTDAPTTTPTKAPTDHPTKAPTDAPTTTPTKAPTDNPASTSSCAETFIWDDEFCTFGNWVDMDRDLKGVRTRSDNSKTCNSGENRGEEIQPSGTGFVAGFYPTGLEAACDSCAIQIKGKPKNKMRTVDIPMGGCVNSVEVYMEFFIEDFERGDEFYFDFTDDRDGGWASKERLTFSDFPTDNTAYKSSIVIDTTSLNSDTFWMRFVVNTRQAGDKLHIGRVIVEGKE